MVMRMVVNTSCSLIFVFSAHGRKGVNDVTLKNSVFFSF